VTVHWGASVGFGDTEHVNATVSVNPLIAARFKVAEAGMPGDTEAGVSVKAETAKSSGVVSLNTAPKPLLP
jgi:hypothetical protein